MGPSLKSFMASKNGTFRDTRSFFKPAGENQQKWLLEIKILLGPSFDYEITLSVYFWQKIMKKNLDVSLCCSWEESASGNWVEEDTVIFLNFWLCWGS